MPLSAATSKATVSGFGTIISIGGVTGSTGTETFTAVGEVKDVKDSGFKTTVLDATNFDSKRVKQNVAGVIDLGSVSITVNRISNDPGQLALSAAQFTGLPYDFRIQKPVNPLLGQTTSGDFIIMSGIVTEGSGGDISTSAVEEMTFTVTRNSYSYTEGS